MGLAYFPCTWCGADLGTLAERPTPSSLLSSVYVPVNSTALCSGSDPYYIVSLQRLAVILTHAALLSGMPHTRWGIYFSHGRGRWFAHSIAYPHKAAAAKSRAAGRKPARTRCNCLGTRRLGSRITVSSIILEAHIQDFGLTR